MPEQDQPFDELIRLLERSKAQHKEFVDKMNEHSLKRQAHYEKMALIEHEEAPYKQEFDTPNEAVLVEDPYFLVTLPYGISVRHSRIVFIREAGGLLDVVYRLRSIDEDYSEVIEVKSTDYTVKLSEDREVVHFDIGECKVSNTHESTGDEYLSYLGNILQTGMYQYSPQ